MGKINRFDLSRIVAKFKTPIFFETGTFRGDGVQYALQSPFKKIISVEIIPELAEEAKKKFAGIERVKIIEGESSRVMEEELPNLTGNCIFWLDAHFPGADAGMTDYDAEMDESVRLPLVVESSIINRLRKGFKDVIIMDDLRIYEDGPYQNGNVPVDALPKKNRNINFVNQNFGDTHHIYKSYQEEGYLLLLPKLSRKRWSIANLFLPAVPKPTSYLKKELA
ncbi:MAG: hypothetical protein ABI675_26615 [Chitinophagaceae bacterium]